MSMNIEFLPLTLKELPGHAAGLKDEGYRFVQMLCVKTDGGTDMLYTYMKDDCLKNYTIKDVKKGTKVPSISGTYLNAFFYENEAHDLFGIDVEGIAIDFAGAFYDLAHSEPMTVISPAQKEAREKAAKIAAAKAAKEAKEAKATKEAKTPKGAKTAKGAATAGEDGE